MADDWLRAASRLERPARVDSSQPNVARVWNYLIGGRDNFEADRRTARQLVAASPAMALVAPAARAFRRRSVGYLAGEAGLRQFLDIGTGIPAPGNTHELAQRADRSSRVVYVDNDPVVASHARASLRSAPEGAVSYLDADARDTDLIVAGARDTLDLNRPVGVLLVDVLNFLEDAAGVVRRLVAAVPSGSYLVVMHPSRDERIAVAAQRWNQLAPSPLFLRSRQQVGQWLLGLDLVPPGLVEVHQWRPDGLDSDSPGGVPLLGAVARKP